jgi:hypothetical protein
VRDSCAATVGAAEGDALGRGPGESDPAGREPGEADRRGLPGAAEVVRPAADDADEDLDGWDAEW